uniref:hypothetical protein n=1 Tax=Phocaeicola sp. TaxID=2773926 RepID=UPI003FF0E4EF
MQPPRHHSPFRSIPVLVETLQCGQLLQEVQVLILRVDARQPHTVHLRHTLHKTVAVHTRRVLHRQGDHMTHTGKLQAHVPQLRLLHQPHALD